MSDHNASISSGGFIWKTALRWTSGIAVEYGVLSLIEDAPVAVKLSTIAIGVLGLLALQFEKTLRKWHRHLFVSVLIGLAVIYVGTVGLGWYLRSPFSAEVRIVINSSPVKDKLTMFVVGHGGLVGRDGLVQQIVSPIPFLLYAQVTNLENVPSNITDYSVEVSSYRFGPWHPLPSISLRSCDLYVIGVDVGPPGLGPPGKSLRFSRGSYLLATPPAAKYLASGDLLKPDHLLESELGHNIQPHDHVEGWAAFDHADNFMVFRSKSIYFRITVRDSAGLEGSTVSKIPVFSNESSDTTMATFTRLGLVRDLSDDPILPYSGK
jgi:hypothetical protein